MGYKDENIKHRLGVDKSKYKCPKCEKPLSIDKPKFLTVCSSCKYVIKQRELE